MARLLDRMPFTTEPGEVAVRGERVVVRANQIIIWLAITPASATAPGPASSPFPAIMDTGHTHTLSIHEEHLTRWAGLRSATLRQLGPSAAAVKNWNSASRSFGRIPTSRKAATAERR